MTDAALPFGLIAAIPEEISHFGAHFEETAVTDIAGFRFRQGRLEGRAAVLVEAGIGKVNAAIVATLLVERFGCRALLFSGVAGGLDPGLGIGDVVVATRILQHDYGALVQGRLTVYQPGALPLPGIDATHGYALDPGLESRARAALADLRLPALPAAATGGAARQPLIRFGTIVTGDQFVNCEQTRRRLHEEFTAHATEMEGAAVAQVAQRYGLACLIVRSLSDLAGADSHMDFGAFVAVAATGAALIMRRLAAIV